MDDIFDNILELTGKRAKWKKKLARQLKFDPDELQFHEAFVDWLTGESARGRNHLQQRQTV